MSESTGERTEQASERQMKDVRKKGKLSRSQDVSAWIVVGAVAVMIPSTIGAAAAAATDTLYQLHRVAGSADPMIALQVLAEAGASLGPTLMPLLAVAVAAAVGAALIQGKVTFRSLAPRFDHLNPVSAAKKIAGPQAWWNAVKALVKSSAVGLVLYWVIQSVITSLSGTGVLPLEAVTQITWGSIQQLIWLSVIAGIVMAAADMFVVAKRNRKQTRVTKDEAKREHKQSEGDPMIKGQRRARQMAMSRNRMIADVSGADAVVVNPVHVAVAIRYRESDAAPVVVAVGKGHVAESIREKARESEVPLIKAVELAWMMHDHCRIGAPVPPQLYSAVATVIAFTRRLDDRARRKRIHDLGAVTLPEEWAQA